MRDSTKRRDAKGSPVRRAPRGALATVAFAAVFVASSIGRATARGHGWLRLPVGTSPYFSPVRFTPGVRPGSETVALDIFRLRWIEMMRATPCNVATSGDAQGAMERLGVVALLGGTLRCDWSQPLLRSENVLTGAAPPRENVGNLAGLAPLAFGDAAAALVAATGSLTVGLVGAELFGGHGRRSLFSLFRVRPFFPQSGLGVAFRAAAF